MTILLKQTKTSFVIFIFLFILIKKEMIKTQQSQIIKIPFREQNFSTTETIVPIKKINSKNIARDLPLMEIREIMRTRGEGRRPKYVPVAGSSENLCSSRRSTPCHITNYHVTNSATTPSPVCPHTHTLRSRVHARI